MNLDREICASVWTSSGPDTLLKTLCHEIGPRPPGTPSMNAAQELLADVLIECECENIHREPVPILQWHPQPATVEMLQPRRRIYPAIHHVNSSSADVSGHLIDIGIPSEQRLDKLGKILEGSIALVRGFEVSGSKFTPVPLAIERLENRGVKAVLMQSIYVEGCPAIELVGIERVSPTPVVGVSPGVARELEGYSHARAVMHVQTNGTVSPGQCSNLIADLNSPANSTETVILSAHLDTFYLNPGAFDNLTGVLTLIEIVRALAPLRPAFTRHLRVVLFTGEEYGFLGSKGYVSAHRAELDSTAFILNLDSLWPQTAEGMAVMGSPWMRDYIDDCFRAAGRRVSVRDMFCMSSDYLPFFLAGIVAARPADFQNSMPPWSHTTEDTADKISTDWIRMNAMVYAQVLARILTDSRPLQTRRRTRDEVSRDVDAADARLELQSMGFCFG